MKLEWKSCFKVGLSIFILYLCMTYWRSAAGVIGSFLSAASPLFIGCIIAYIVNLLMSFYEKKWFPKTKKKFLIRSRRPFCMLGAFVTLLAVVGIVVWIVAPQLTSAVTLLVSKIPLAMKNLVAQLDKFHLLPEEIIVILESIDWRSRIDSIVQLVTSGMGNAVDVVVGTVTSVFSITVTVVLSIIFSVYILSEKERLSGNADKLMSRYFKPELYNGTKYVAAILNDCFRRYIVGQCTEAVVLGALCTVGMLVLRLPYATMVGAFIAFTALIPVAGAYIGAFVGAFMILTVSPMQALVFLVFIIVLQQLEGNLIYPKVVGSSLGLPGIWVLAAVTVGGGMMGVAGMLFGVPVAAALYRIVKNNVNKKQITNGETK